MALVLPVIHFLLCLVLVVRSLRWQYTHPLGEDSYDALAVWAFYAAAVGALSGFFPLLFYIAVFSYLPWWMIAGGIFLLTLPLLPAVALKRSIGKKANLVAALAVVAAIPWSWLLDRMPGSS